MFSTCSSLRIPLSGAQSLACRCSEVVQAESLQEPLCSTPALNLSCSVPWLGSPRLSLLPLCRPGGIQRLRIYWKILRLFCLIPPPAPAPTLGFLRSLVINWLETSKNESQKVRFQEL